jgi:hypothetical protein
VSQERVGLEVGVHPAPDVFDQFGEFERDIAAAGFFEVDNADPCSIPEEVGQVAVRLTEHRRQARVTIPARCAGVEPGHAVGCGFGDLGVEGAARELGIAAANVLDALVLAPGPARQPRRHLGRDAVVQLGEGGGEGGDLRRLDDASPQYRPGQTAHDEGRGRRTRVKVEGDGRQARRVGLQQGQRLPLALVLTLGPLTVTLNHAVGKQFDRVGGPPIRHRSLAFPLGGSIAYR